MFDLFKIHLKGTNKLRFYFTWIFNANAFVLNNLKIDNWKHNSLYFTENQNISNTPPNGTHFKSLALKETFNTQIIINVRCISKCENIQYFFYLSFFHLFLRFFRF